MSDVTTRRLTGWGRSTASIARVHTGLRPADVPDWVRRCGEHGVLARGLGRSYGDAAQNAGGDVLAPLVPDAPIELDREAGVAQISAGTSIERALRTLLPQGFTLPVLPGTRFVTVGGAVAADVHGKNHHVDGSFGRWVREIDLVDGCGQSRTLSPDRDEDAFWATVGGMGLTGVIRRVTVELVPVRSASMRVRSRRYDDLDGVIDAMTASTARHHVAWVDAASHRTLGRSLLDEGEFADDERSAYEPRRPVPAPRLPLNLVRPAPTRLANAMWWRHAPADRTSVVPFTTFFHPLDAVGDWHRVYGPGGLVQWQMVVPATARRLIEQSLRQLLDAGVTPALVVLKRMGPGSPAPLSFPVEGWTLAVDVPATAPRLRTALDKLHEQVADAGGRVYFAKDSAVAARLVPVMYPRLTAWHEVRHRLDPRGVMRSDLGRRLGLL